MTTTDPENASRLKRVALLSQDDVERIERSLTAGEPGPGFGFVEPPPPYEPGPRRKLPSWAEHLRDLRPLKLLMVPDNDRGEVPSLDNP